MFQQGAELRILTVVGSFGLGGTERVAFNFSTAFARAGNSVAVLSHNEGGERREAFEKAGINTFVATENAHAFAEANDFDPDIIHIHRSGDPNARETNLLRQLKTKNRKVIETNVFAQPDLSEGGGIIDVHMLLTPWCMWQWQRRLGKRRGTLPGVIIPNPVREQDFKRAQVHEIAKFRSELGIPETAFVVGRSGRPSMHKWDHENLAAYTFLAKKYKDVYGVFVGLPSELQAVITAMPRDLKGRVRSLPITSSDTELSLFYSSLDLYLHASKIGESFGMVLAEAMLCGCPIVTASTPNRDNSQLEVVGHLKGGVVSGSVQSLGRAADWLYCRPALRQRMREGIRKHVIDRYNSDSVAAKVLQVARYTLKYSDRSSLIRALREDNYLPTQISTKQIIGTLRNSIGQPDPKDLIKMFLSYTDHRWIPALYSNTRKIVRCISIA